MYVAIKRLCKLTYEKDGNLILPVFCTCCKNVKKEKLDCLHKRDYVIQINNELSETKRVSSC
jgi:hypothetical protein